MDTEENKIKIKGSENPFFIESKPKSKKKWVILAIVVLLALVVAAFIFNLFGIKDMLISTIIENEPGYVEAYGKLEDRQKELDQKQQTIDQRQTELDSREKKLDKRQEQLEEKEKKSEGTATESGTGGSAALAEQEKENYTRLAKIYENMEPKNAAKTFEAMNDNEEVAKIMKYMKAKSSGAVLEQLSSQVAAEISKLMTK